MNKNIQLAPFARTLLCLGFAAATTQASAAPSPAPDRVSPWLGGCHANTDGEIKASRGALGNGVRNGKPNLDPSLFARMRL